MEKVLRLGTSKTYGGRTFSVFAKVKYDGERLSIVGVEGPLPTGNALGGCGQIHDTILGDDFVPNSAMGQPMVDDFIALWKRYHLNDMHSGCEHQRAMGWTYATHKGRACPVCTCEIGFIRHNEEVPTWVIEYIESMPDTDREPAWI